MHANVLWIINIFLCGEECLCNQNGLWTSGNSPQWSLWSKPELKGADLHALHTFHILFYMRAAAGGAQQVQYAAKENWLRISTQLQCEEQTFPQQHGEPSHLGSSGWMQPITRLYVPCCVLMLNTLLALSGICTANKCISCPWMVSPCSQSVNTVVLPVLISGGENWSTLSAQQQQQETQKEAERCTKLPSFKQCSPSLVSDLIFKIILLLCWLTAVFPGWKKTTEPIETLYCRWNKEWGHHLPVS